MTYPTSTFDYGDGVAADGAVTTANADAIVAALIDDDNATDTSLALHARFSPILDTVEGVAVSAAGIHAALVELGLITA